MARITDKEDRLLMKVRDRRDLFRGRNQAIEDAYSMYFQHDKWKREGDETLAVSDARAAADLAIHILSRNPHLDRLPRTVESPVVQTSKDKGERFLKGLWREVDFGQSGYARRGRSAHQRELSSWSIITGWVVQFTALIPDAKGFPLPIADLLDPSGVYPWWDGPRGELSGLAHEYTMSFGRLKRMAEAAQVTLDETDIEDDQIITVLDYWESRTNRLNRDQPDILNSWFWRMGEGAHASEWFKARDFFNHAPGSTDTVLKSNGFTELPYIIYRPNAVPVSGAYLKDFSEVLRKTTGGLVGPMKTEWEALNKWLMFAMQDVKEALKANMTVAHTSPGGQDLIERSEVGGIIPLDPDSRLTSPLARNPIVAATNVIVEQIQRRIEHMGFPETLFGATSRGLTGVAIDRLNEGARSRVEPHKTHAEFLYSDTGRVWITEYLRRWHGKSRFGKVKLQGFDGRAALASGLFEEEFTPGDVPETNYVKSDIKLALPEDEMMKANIASRLNPDIRMSQQHVLENVLDVEDIFMEMERAGEDRVLNSEVWTNVQMFNKLIDEAERYLAKGDAKSQFTGQAFQHFARQIAQSITPQQGRGIEQRPRQGEPGVGGLQGGSVSGNAALSPSNAPNRPADVEAPAGGGLEAQARRNA